MNRPLRQLITAAALATLAAVIAWPAADNGYSLDDYNWLARATFRSSTLEFVTTPEPGQTTNPVTRVGWLGIVDLGGSDPRVAHGMVLVLHLIAVLLLWRNVAAMTDGATGLAAGVLFAAHPAGAEAVFWVAAFPHVMVATLVLAAAAGVRRWSGGGSRPGFAGAIAAIVGALMSKATAAAVVPVIAVGSTPPSGSADRRRLGLAAVVAATLIAWLGLQLWEWNPSYLVERGLYGMGSHLVGNLVTAIGTLVLPWSGLWRELGVAPAVASVRVLAGVVAAAGIAGILVRGTGFQRWWAALGLAALAPVVPFLAAPASRYLYLPAIACCALLAPPLVRISRRRWWRPVVVGLLCLVAVADWRLRDNHYEYRERLMTRIVDAVTQAVGPEPEGRTLRVAGLPRLALDPGIHLEAALQLAWDDPEIRLEIVPPDATDPGQLRWNGARITAGTRESPSAR